MRVVAAVWGAGVRPAVHGGRDTGQPRAGGSVNVPGAPILPHGECYSLKIVLGVGRSSFSVQNKHKYDISYLLCHFHPSL